MSQYARRAAHHEAGHLVAYRTLGLPVVSVVIEPHESGQWTGEVTPPWPTFITPATFEARAIAGWAGPIAERVHVTGRHVKNPHWLELAVAFGGREDIVEPEQWGEKLGITGWRTRTKSAAVALVRDHWSDIEHWAGRIEAEQLIEWPENQLMGVMSLASDAETRAWLTTQAVANGMRIPDEPEASPEGEIPGAVRIGKPWRIPNPDNYFETQDNQTISS